MFSTVIFLLAISWGDCIIPEIQEKFETLPRDDFVKYFNSQNFTWTIKNNDHISPKVMRCVELSKSIPVNSTKRNNYSRGYAPVEMDIRLIWPFVGDVDFDNLDTSDNGCSSCWSDAAANVATDRTIIHKLKCNTHLTLVSSDLACCKNCFSKSYCSGGSLEKAMSFWIRYGLVPKQCKHIERKGEECVEMCDNDEFFYHKMKFYGDRQYIVVGDEHAIKTELLLNGPLLVDFLVYEDFRDYSSGIYEHTHGKLIGASAAKIIGYGEENGVKFWTAVNYWGKQWGNHGIFRIKRYQEDIQFETNMLSVFPAFL